MSEGTFAPSHGTLSAPARADTEVVVRPVRRRFSAEHKLRILQAADQPALRSPGCTPGELGALLRREGLYSSHLTSWRRQRETGQLVGLASKKRGPRPDPQAEELARVRRENERLQARLQQAEAIIDAQKKLSHLFGLNLPIPAGAPK